MARVKSSRSNGKNKQAAVSNATTISEVTAVAESRKYPPPIPINVEEEIRRRAYELYEQRGGAPGHERDDWFLAEREVLARYQQSA